MGWLTRQNTALVLHTSVRCKHCRAITKRRLTTSGIKKEKVLEKAKVRAKAMDIKPMIQAIKIKEQVVVEKGAVVVERAKLAVGVHSAAAAPPPPVDEHLP